MSGKAKVEMIKESHAVNGVVLHTLVCGNDEAPVVLFLHGFPTYSGVWQPLMAELSADFRCVAPDLRGFGRSEKPQEVDQYDIGNGIADIAALIEKLSPNRPVLLVGHDLGGYLSYQIAAQHAELLSGLVVINGPHPDAFREAIAVDPAQAQASAYIDFLCSETAAEMLSKDDFAGLVGTYDTMLNGRDITQVEQDGLIGAWSQDGTVEAMLKWYRANRVALSGQALDGDATAEKQATCPITVPHLLIWGEQDPYLLKTCHERIDPHVDRLEKLLLQDAGHAPYATHLPETIAAIRAFVEVRLADWSA